MKEMMDLKMSHSWQHVNHENMNSNYQEWHNTTSNDTEERIALPNARWRMLELLWKESQWTLRKGNKSLINHHVVPPWRTPVTKNDQTKGKRGWKHKVNPCTDLDESPWCTNWKRLGLQEKEEMKQLKTESLMSLWNKELLTWWSKNKNYVMRIHHQFKLVTINGPHTTYSRRKD